MSTLTPTLASGDQLLDIYDSQVHAIVVSLAVCLPAAYIAVVLRFVSRRIGKVPLKADDWWLVVGLVSRRLLSKLPCLGYWTNLIPSYKQLFTSGFVACGTVVTHLGPWSPRRSMTELQDTTSIVVLKA